MNKISELCYKIDSALDGTEINIANYNEDNIKKLNDAMIEVSLLLKELKEEAQRVNDLYSLGYQNTLKLFPQDSQGSLKGW